MYVRCPFSSFSATGFYSFSMSFLNLLIFLTIKSLRVSSKWFGKWFKSLNMCKKESIYLLHFIHPVACLRVENLLDGPGKSPENVPVIISLGFLPSTFFKIMYECVFVQVCFVLEFHLGLLPWVCQLVVIKVYLLVLR